MATYVILWLCNWKTPQGRLLSKVREAIAAHLRRPLHLSCLEVVRHSVDLKQVRRYEGKILKASCSLGPPPSSRL